MSVVVVGQEVVDGPCEDGYAVRVFETVIWKMRVDFDPSTKNVREFLVEGKSLSWS